MKTCSRLILKVFKLAMFFCLIFFPVELLGKHKKLIKILDFLVPLWSTVILDTRKNKISWTIFSLIDFLISASTCLDPDGPTFNFLHNLGMLNWRPSILTLAFPSFFFFIFLTDCCHSGQSLTQSVQISLSQLCSVKWWLKIAFEFWGGGYG